MSERAFLALVRYDPDKLRRKNDWSERDEVLSFVDTALFDSSVTSHIHVNDETEVLDLLHEARRLLQDPASMTKDERLSFLADSECYLADKLGERPRY